MTASAPHILIVTATELTRDPRARRQVAAACARGFAVSGLSGTTGEQPVPLEGIQIVRVTTGRAATMRTSHEVRRRRSPSARELRGLARIARLFLTTCRFAAVGLRLGRFDVVHANDLATLPASWIIGRRSRARLVYDAHELYSDAEIDPPRFQRRAYLGLERMVAQRSLVVTVSEPMADELTRVLQLRSRPTVVLNCPPLDRQEPELKSATRPVRAIYQAAVGTGRDPNDVLKAATIVPELHVTLRILGADLNRLRDQIRALSLEERVEVAEPLPPERLVPALREFEIGVIIDRPVTRNNELAFPNKLFEYLMAGLAVVVPRLTALGEFVERERVGVVYEPGSPEDLGRALDRLSHDASALVDLRRRAREAAVERFNADVQAVALGRAWAS